MMRARAVVQVMLSIDVGDSWGDNCSVAQVRKQATEAAEGTLRRLLGSDANGSSNSRIIKYIRDTAKVSIVLEDN